MADVLAHKFKDWPWQYVAKFERAHASNVIELIVNLGFDFKAHIRFVLHGIDSYVLSSKDVKERKIALSCVNFISEQLLSSDQIIVESLKQENSRDYCGNIMYNRSDDKNKWFSLSNEMIANKVLEISVSR